MARDERQEPDEPSTVRLALASWLEGPGRATDDVARGYPGERLGLPEKGPGALAGVGRRLAAFAVDWLLCASIAGGLLHDVRWSTPIFVLESCLLMLTLGGSAGHLVLGLRVGRLGGPVTVGAVLTRTLLLCLLVPAVIWDRDGRGLHDRVARTVLLQR